MDSQQLGALEPCGALPLLPDRSGSPILPGQDKPDYDLQVLCAQLIPMLWRAWHEVPVQLCPTYQ